MVTVKLFVEGGGDARDLKRECRRGFSLFLSKAGIKNRTKISACGDRREAYKSYCTAIKNGEPAMLLVDSEEAVASIYQSGERNKWDPWGHLKQRQGDGWAKPAQAEDMDCHLMVQCMESWFLADPDTLKKFYASGGFNANPMPHPNTSLEQIGKLDVYSKLEDATRQNKKQKPYGKGPHSFKLLALIDPALVRERSEWAERFIEGVKGKMVG